MREPIFVINAGSSSDSRKSGMDDFELIDLKVTS
jgi:hypothetical protein